MSARLVGIALSSLATSTMGANDDSTYHENQITLLASFRDNNQLFIATASWQP